MSIPNQVLVLEGGITVGFLMLLLFVHRRSGRADDILWGLVWTTRLFASLNGARHFGGSSLELGVYMGLQALSGLSLMLILMRSELRLLRERLARHLLLQLSKSSQGAGLE